MVEATLKRIRSRRYRQSDRPPRHDLTTPPPRCTNTPQQLGIAIRRDNWCGSLPIISRSRRRSIPDQSDGASAAAGDTVPCDSLDQLAAGADALVHTVIRKDIVTQIPQQRVKDICDYHSSVQEAAATANRAGVGTLAQVTHYAGLGARTRRTGGALVATEAGGSRSATTYRSRCTRGAGARQLWTNQPRHQGDRYAQRFEPAPGPYDPRAPHGLGLSKLVRPGRLWPATVPPGQRRPSNPTRLPQAAG